MSWIRNTVFGSTVPGTRGQELMQRINAGARDVAESDFFNNIFLTSPVEKIREEQKTENRP
jgi:hypothetical protein